MEKTYTVDEINELLSICYNEFETELMKTADENNEPESRKDELKFALLLHITPYRLMIMKKLMSEDE